MVHTGTQPMLSCILWWISLLQTSPLVCLPILPAEVPSPQISSLLTPLWSEMQRVLALALDAESRGSGIACPMLDNDLVHCGIPETICSCPTVLEKGHYCQIPCKWTRRSQIVSTPQSLPIKHKKWWCSIHQQGWFISCIQWWYFNANSPT